MEREAFRLRMQQYKLARDYSPLLKYWDWKKYAEGGEIDDDDTSNSERPIINFDPKGDPYKPQYGYNPGAGYVSNTDPIAQMYVEGIALSPVFKLAGKALNSIVRTADNYSAKAIPEVRRTVLDLINQLFRREAERKVKVPNLYEQAVENRNRIIEDLVSDPAYYERAKLIKKVYGDDYVSAYNNVILQYNDNYFGLPEPVIKLLNARAKMQASELAVSRYSRTKQPAGYNDFEFQISRDLDNVGYPITRHEMGHYVDFNLAKSSNPDKGNALFANMKKDLSKDPNPLMPKHTDYFSKGTELKSYMNTLREFMLLNGLIDSIGAKVTTRLIKKAIKMLPKEDQAIEAAYLLFSNPGSYTKWFNKIPLLGVYPVINNHYEEDQNQAGE